MKYYRLIDTEIPRLMLSGYNETSLDEIKECILVIGRRRIGETKLKKLENLEINVLASHFDIEIQESTHKFPESEDPIHLITLDKE